MNPELARLSVDDRQHDHAEVDLHLRVLVQIVQDDFGVLAALQLDDDAHAVAIALVADVADAFDALFVHQRGDVGDQPRLVHLVRKLGDDERFAVAPDVFRRDLGAELQAAAARGVVIDDAALPKKKSAGREVGTRNDLQHFGQSRCSGSEPARWWR